MTATTMRAMVLERSPGELRLKELPRPEPGSGQLLIKVHACGVCRTDLHVVDGDLTEPKLPLVPGHEVVGRVAALGVDVERFAARARVAVAPPGAICWPARLLPSVLVQSES